MPSSDKYSGLLPRPQRERGNILFMILIAIALLALLTLAISQSSTEQSSILPQQTIDNQINQMITYASALGGAAQQMATNGEDPNTLCTNLSLLKPGDAHFEDSPANLKIYHPLGGGISYQSQSAPDANAVATSYNINAASSITGVGCTPGNGTCSSGGTYSSVTNTCSAGVVTGLCTTCTGHIIFTALMSSAAYCAETNRILSGSSAVPVMDSATFTSLFGSPPSTPPATVTITSGNCASCVNTARLCVSNTGATAWGFYADLFPPQNSNAQ